MSDPPNTHIFNTRPSSSGFGFLIPGIIFLSIALILIAIARFLPGWASITFTIVFAAFGLFLLAFGLFTRNIVKTMRYVLTDSMLKLFGGPVHYEIPLDTIKRAYARDIYTGPSNQVRIATATGINTPNLALSNVTWKDTGMLKMCGTPGRVTGTEHIVIIETDKDKYGITPLDESAFLDALRTKGIATDAPPTP
ncbi:MAG: PH domain-containing protein [Chloroflexia bacterium]